MSRTAEDRCLLEILEVRDALLRGRDAAAPLRDRLRLFGRPPRGAGGVVEGYEPALGRFDRMLSRFDVRRCRPWDVLSTAGSCMRWRRVASTRIGDGVVIEELRSGFVRRDAVLRLADVMVNRRQEEG